MNGIPKIDELRSLALENSIRKKPKVEICLNNDLRELVNRMIAAAKNGKHFLIISLGDFDDVKFDDIIHEGYKIEVYKKIRKLRDLTCRIRRIRMIKISWK